MMKQKKKRNNSRIPGITFAERLPAEVVSKLKRIKGGNK